MMKRILSIFAFMLFSCSINDDQVTYEEKIVLWANLRSNFPLIDTVFVSKSARCALNLLANLKKTIGDLDKVTQIVKLLGMVNCAPDFTDHPKVINGASDLFVEAFGDKGRHARSAVGMGALPMNISVEIEAIIEVAD